MALYPVAGCKIYIGGIKATKKTDFTAADFASETWTEVDGWSSMGPFGDTAALITTSLINQNRDIKQKGTTNAGTMQNVFAAQDDDAGQIKMKAAAAGAVKDSYSFRVDFNDAVGTGAPSKVYFVALVMSAQIAGGTANTIRNLNATLELNSNIVYVANT